MFRMSRSHYSGTEDSPFLVSSGANKVNFQPAHSHDKSDRNHWDYITSGFAPRIGHSQVHGMFEIHLLPVVHELQTPNLIYFEESRIPIAECG